MGVLVPTPGPTVRPRAAAGPVRPAPRTAPHPDATCLLLVTVRTAGTAGRARAAPGHVCATTTAAHTEFTFILNGLHARLTGLEPATTPLLSGAFCLLNYGRCRSEAARLGVSLPTAASRLRESVRTSHSDHVPSGTGADPASLRTLLGYVLGPVGSLPGCPDSNWVPPDPDRELFRTRV